MQTPNDYHKIDEFTSGLRQFIVIHFPGIWGIGSDRSGPLPFVVNENFQVDDSPLILLWLSGLKQKEHEPQACPAIFLPPGPLRFSEKL